MGSYVRQGGGGRRRRSGRARGPPRVWAFADRSFSVGRGGCLSVGGWACLSLDGGEVAWNSRGACGASGGRRSNAGPAGGARRVWKVARVGRGRTRFRPPGVVRVRAGLGGRVEGAELVEEELVVLAHLLHAEQLVLAFLGRRRRPAGAAVPRLLLLGELGDGGELGGLGGLGGGDGGVGGRGGGGRLGGRGGGGRLGGRGGRDGLRGGLRERARRRESRAGSRRTLRFLRRCLDLDLAAGGGAIETRGGGGTLRSAVDDVAPRSRGASGRTWPFATASARAARTSAHWASRAAWWAARRSFSSWARLSSGILQSATRVTWRTRRRSPDSVTW